MGRIAQTFAGLNVVDMLPYNMVTELVLGTSSTAPTAFPNNDLANSTDKPFAVHRMIPEIVALDSNGLVVDSQPDIRVMGTLIKISGSLTGPNQDIFKAPVRLQNLLQGTTAQHAWSYEEPFVMPSASNVGLQLFATCDAFPAGFANKVEKLRITINLQGYLLVIAPQA